MKKQDEGFTLIELLIVIVILGILATVVVFAVGGITDRGQESACDADFKTLEVAYEAYRAQERWLPHLEQRPGVVLAQRADPVFGRSRWRNHPHRGSVLRQLARTATDRVVSSSDWARSSRPGPITFSGTVVASARAGSAGTMGGGCGGECRRPRRSSRSETHRYRRSRRGHYPSGSLQSAILRSGSSQTITPPRGGSSKTLSGENTYGPTSSSSPRSRFTVISGMYHS